MNTENLKTIKSDILSCINSNIKTQEKITEKIYHQDEEIINELNSLTAQNILKFDKNTKEYNFCIEPKGEKVILDGNILLPITLIRKKDELIVCRGMWYSLPPDFDINRIIWNVALEPKTKSSLVDMLQLTKMKVSKAKIKQVEEYQKLVNLIIPYNDKIKLQINIVGKQLTSVTIMFVKKLYFDNSKKEYVEYRGFRIKSEIETSQLIEQLKRNKSERNFEEIKLNKVFNFNDLIFSKNEIPYFYDGKNIEFVSLDKIRGEFRLKHFSFNNSSVLKELDIELHNSLNDGGRNKLIEYFKMFISEELENMDFVINY